MVRLSPKSILLLAMDWRGEIAGMRKFAIMNNIDWEYVVTQRDQNSDNIDSYAESLIRESLDNEKSFLACLDYIGLKEDSSSIVQVNKELSKSGYELMRNDDGEWELVEKTITDNDMEDENSVEPVKKQSNSRTSTPKQESIEPNIEQIKHNGIEKAYELRDPSTQSDVVLEKIISLIDSKLRKAIRSKPEKEKDVQDALENLFIGADLDKIFTREKENLEYSGKAYIPDFVFRTIKTVVEAKLCNSSKREKEIIDEINADIAAYKTAYVNLIFVIYDLGIIRDLDKMKSQLEENKNVTILIVKH